MRVGFLVEAGSAVGLGHYMRNLPLMRELARRGHEVTVWVWGDHSPVDLKVACHASAELALIDARSCSADVYVVDGYRWPREVSDILPGQKVVGWSDLPDDAFSGVIATINQNAYAPSLQYKKSAGTLLLGLDYLSLRPEFIAARAKTNARVHLTASALVDDGVDNGDDTRVVVSMGGADPRALTEYCLQALQDADNPRPIRVIVGPANTQASQLQVQASQLIDVRVSPDNMAEALVDASVALVAAGSTVYELIYLGVPFVALIVADNQSLCGAWLAEHGVPVLDARASRPSHRAILDAINAARGHACEVQFSGNGALQLRAFLEERIRA